MVFMILQDLINTYCMLKSSTWLANAGCSVLCQVMYIVKAKVVQLAWIPLKPKRG